jgi:hypothetical protein
MGCSGGVGGGIAVRCPSGVVPTLRIVNSTITGNSACDSGGGLHVACGTVLLSNVTIVDNVADSDVDGSGVAGGIFRSGGTVQLQNSILSGNLGHDLHAPDECAGSLVSGDYNLIGPTSFMPCVLSGATTHNLVAPLDSSTLGALADNGGSTPTRAPLPGSPSIDGGNPAGCTDDLGNAIKTDQRGYGRPAGAACDIGAFEAGAVPPTTTTTTTTVPGCAVAATFDSIRCRLDVLRSLADASIGAGKLHDHLIATLDAAHAKLDGAQSASGRARARSLTRSAARLTKFRRQLGSKAAKRAVPDAGVRSSLATAAGDLARDLGLLRSG